MSRTDSYSSNRRRNRRRGERQGRARESRAEARSRERNREADRKSFRDSRKSSERREAQRGIQREIQRILQKVATENESALREFRKNVCVCELCGKSIPSEDMDSALSNRETGNPAHFDCVLNQVSERERLGNGERIAYIGQGKFAVLYFANSNDLRKFTIQRTIEWENREKRLGWRDEIAEIFSKVR